MKRFARAFAVTFGLAVCGTVVSLVPQRSATGAGSAPVTVTNTSLPVTGNVTVSGTVAAQQSGSWSVGISGTPNFNVGNFPATLAGSSVPVSVQRSASFVTLYWVSPNGPYDERLPDGTVVTSAFTIPQGEQLVITDVSWTAYCLNGVGVTCSLSAGDAVIFVLGTNLGGDFYVSEATYAPRQGALLAGRTDHVTGGIVVTQLPTATILGGSAGNGETVGQTILQGYLVP